MIRMILEVSTGHLCPATCKQLDAWAASINLVDRAANDMLLPLFMAGTEFGWLVRCSGVSVLTEPEIPDDLMACLVVGSRFGVDFVLFDADADECAVMPWGGGPGGDTERESV